MKPSREFRDKPKSFWAAVRTLSQGIGYGKKDNVIVPTIAKMAECFRKLGLDEDSIISGNRPTQLATDLERYFKARATALEENVLPNLMNAADARSLFLEVKKDLAPRCPLPMNKQKREKKANAYLTCIVNMLIEKHSQGYPCNYDPQELTTITTEDRLPLRTLARRVDGAFTSPVNPIAVWEIKEYYYTTTFGSRVADGVYESLLDGLELEETRKETGIDIKHYLIVDARDTWWLKGKPYLCRIYDMLHMQYVDEVLFGREVINELPRIVGEWITEAKARSIPKLAELPLLTAPPPPKQRPRQSRLQR